MGGKKRETQFFQKHTNSATKNVGKKSSQKVRKSVFYIRKNIVTKKWGEKRAKQFFQKLKNSASKKCWEKIVGKKGKKAIFIFARIP